MEKEKMTPEQVKRWRTSRDLTQQQAAKLLGVDRLTWQNWEAGRSKPPVYLADALIVKDGVLAALKAGGNVA